MEVGSTLSGTAPASSWAKPENPVSSLNLLPAPTGSGEGGLSQHRAGASRSRPRPRRQTHYPKRRTNRNSAPDYLGGKKAKGGSPLSILTLPYKHVPSRTDRPSRAFQSNEGPAVIARCRGLLQGAGGGLMLALGAAALGASSLWRQFPCLRMGPGPKRVNQVQPSSPLSPAHSCCCYSWERRGRGPDGPKSSSKQEFQMSPSGLREDRRVTARGPRAPRPSGPGTGQCRAVGPARPRYSDHGYFCGAPGRNPGRAASAGAQETPPRVRPRSADTRQIQA